MELQHCHETLKQWKSIESTWKKEKKKMKEKNETLQQQWKTSQHRVEVNDHHIVSCCQRPSCSSSCYLIASRKSSLFLTTIFVTLWNHTKS